VIPGADPDADAVLRGTILKETETPLTYNASTQQSSSFLVTMVVSVTLTGQDGKILYQNKNYVFRQQYESTTELPRFSRRTGGYRAAVARFCAAVGGRCAGRVLNWKGSEIALERRDKIRRPADAVSAAGFPLDRSWVSIGLGFQSVLGSNRPCEAGLERPGRVF